MPTTSTGPSDRGGGGWLALLAVLGLILAAGAAVSTCTVLGVKLARFGIAALKDFAAVSR